MYSNDLWNKFPKHKLGMEKCISNRGTKFTTKNRYWTGYKEYINRLTRAGIKKSEIIVFPTKTIHIAIWMVDCIEGLNGAKNTWSTIRNKMASIDGINKCALTPTSWSDNPHLTPFVAYAKANNLSDPNNVALPFTKRYLIGFIQKINREILYTASCICKVKCKCKYIINSDCDIKRKETFRISLAEISTHKRYLIIRQCVIGAACMAVTGLRIGETFGPMIVNKKAIYGIQIKDIEIYHKREINGIIKIIQDNNLYDIKTLFSIKITLQNSKTRNTNEIAYTIIGRTNHIIDPCLMLYDWYFTLKQLSKAKDNNFIFRKNKYLFQNLDGSHINTDTFRKLFKELVKFCGFIDWERLGLPHALRKGFASQLTKHGVDKGIIAWIGRWKLPEAIYIYISYEEYGQTLITKYYFKAKSSRSYEYDFDEAEYKYFMKTQTTPKRKGFDWSKAFND